RGNLWVWMPLAACVLVGAGLWFATRPPDSERAAFTPPPVATQVARSNDSVAPTPASAPKLQSPAAEDLAPTLKDAERRVLSAPAAPVAPPPPAPPQPAFRDFTATETVDKPAVPAGPAPADQKKAEGLVAGLRQEQPALGRPSPSAS